MNDETNEILKKILILNFMNSGLEKNNLIIFLIF